MAVMSLFHSKDELEGPYLGYSYPISHDWTTEEVTMVVHFFVSVEEAYEKGVKRDRLMADYRNFKEVISSKSEEKQIFREFEKRSGYSAYRVVKTMLEQPEQKVIRME